MSVPFDHFVLFAEMRTGSNFLETNLNNLDGIQCFGEAFNPNFIGYPKRTELLEMTQADRDAAPEKLIAAIRDLPGVLGGFRFFHDHDRRVFEQVIDDRRCAKIVLTRNPLDSYVSRKIAAATGQWKLTDVKRRKEAKAVFDQSEFTQHVGVLQTFQTKLLNRLQASGQTAFYLAYEDLQDVGVLNGLAHWLGTKDRLKKLDRSLKPQNPAPLVDRVENPGEMKEALSGIDPFNLSRTPNFEPRRGPAVPGYVAGTNVPLLFMPIRGGPDAEITRWLAELDGTSPNALETNMNQKRLRQWKRAHPGHRSFTVLRHPMTRAYSVFCSAVLSDGPLANPKLREALTRQFKLKLPGAKGWPTADRHRHGFEVFLDFAQANMAGQTGLGPEPGLITQSAIMSGFAEFALPDFVLREDELPRMLPLLEGLAGRRAKPFSSIPQPQSRYSLSEICDDNLERKVAQVYQRDYMMFGFAPWNDNQAA